jgi:small subunit ribosomal protein S13
MINILNTELIKNKSVLFALLYVFGIGRTRSEIMCKKLGFLPNLKVENLTKKQISSLLQLISNFSNYFYLANDIKTIDTRVRKILISINSTRGIRLKKGLPVRGQRTHSNAKTASRFTEKYKKYKSRNKSKKKDFQS